MSHRKEKLGLRDYGMCGILVGPVLGLTQAIISLAFIAMGTPLEDPKSFTWGSWLVAVVLLILVFATTGLMGASVVGVGVKTVRKEPLEL